MMLAMTPWNRPRPAPLPAWLLLTALALGCSSTVAPDSATGGATGQEDGGAGGTRGAGGAGGAPGAGGAGGNGSCPPGMIWCAGCTPGSGQCASGGCPGFNCPAIDAGTPPGSPACATLTTLAACDARSDCHSVFYDPGTCGCATPGCCAHFSSCADGATANCRGPAACAIASPHCESPYVIAYSNSCFEGCVRATACAP
jgi:hypothetical protein